MSFYVYYWKNNPTRAAWRGRVVRLVCLGILNSALIEDAETGERMVTHRRAIRRLSATKPAKPSEAILGSLEKRRKEKPYAKTFDCIHPASFTR